MTDSNLNVSVININSPNTLIKKQRLSDWIKKQDQLNETNRLKAKGWAEVHHNNTSQRKASYICITQSRLEAKPTERQGEIGKSIIIVRDSKSILSIIYRKACRKISKDRIDLNNTIKYFYFTDIYRTIYSAAEYSFFSITHK